MPKDMDLDKAVRQQIEMEGFFTGFAVRGGRDTQSSVSTRDESCAPAEQPTPPCQRSGLDPAEAARELDALAAEVRQCRLCGLGSSRTHAVPGEGNPRARIMFVGEAPGADEDAQGRPFVGRAGQLLDKIIAACGLKREDVFIGNILKCRPPENRDPRPDEIINCLPYLQRQIETIDPDVIVALGGHAAKTLLNTVKPIGQLRGQFHEYYSGIGRPPIKLMATFHPAYLLRNYSEENRRYVWEDMKKVLTELGLPVPERGKS
ncbi:MAG: uracil-DNA glycosylase [Sedimentisphaerales bacterium]|nr:uracil-DNA glycosylase [Sedimentisphaerales bacterium]